MSLIYSLNIADWVCTVTLLRTGGFYEANPLMNLMIGDLSLGFAVKCILPAVLLVLVYKMYNELGEKEIRYVDKFIAFALALYIALCLVHIANFILWQVRG